jgi:oligopeptidase B
VTGPPAAPTGPRVRDMHGVRTEDPYAWMARHDDPRLLPLLAAERDHYDAETAALRPLRDALAGEFTARLPPAGDSLPWRRGRYLYWEHTPADAEYPQLRRRAVAADAACPEEIVLDGQAAADESPAGHGHFAFGVCEPSPDGRWIAYSADFTGEESYELRFRDTADGGVGGGTGRIPGTSRGCAWSADSAVFFYVTHDAAGRPCRVYRQVPGARPAAGDLVYAEPDERYHVTVATTRSGMWIVITSAARDTSEQWVIPAGDPGAPPRLVERRRRGIEYFAEHLAPPGGPPAPGDGAFVILTNDGAREYRVMRAPVTAPGRASWRELVPGEPGTRFRRLDVVSGHLVLSCRGVATGEPFLRIVRPDGTRHDQHPGTPAGLIELDGSDPYHPAAATVSTQSLVAPKRWWSLDLRTGERSLLRTTRVPGYQETDFHTERLYAPAPDSEMIPVTVACRKSRQPGAGGGPGGGPCLLTGYGAYEACRDPRFSAWMASLLERGFVYAIAHVRGGGERGRRWWLQGRLGAKRNTFTDFRAVRDYLVTGGWAAPDRVAARGLSAGGLTVGTAYTWWPDAWAAVVAEAPAVDLLNVMLDPAAPLTVNEYDEWGDPAEEEQFEWIRSYTPYENVTSSAGPDASPGGGPGADLDAGPGAGAGPGTRRPPLLVTAMLRDPRVAVHEPAKWVAALRAAGVPPDRLLFRVDLASGSHRGPTGRTGALSYEAEILAWVISALAR